MGLESGDSRPPSELVREALSEAMRDGEDSDAYLAPIRALIQHDAEEV